jgi:hypothetical protein
VEQRKDDLIFCVARQNKKYIIEEIIYKLMYSETASIGLIGKLEKQKVF